MSTPMLQPADWGMRWARPPVVHVGMPVSEVYIHQTAGRDPVETFPSGDDKPADAFKALNEWAITGKNYSAIDYSMLVHSGPSMRTTIGVARGRYVPAATLDRNTESKAICLLGWYGPPDPRYPWTYENSREPFHQELVAIAESVVYMVGQGWVTTSAKILGHRDNPEHPGATGCPGDYLQAELPTIRSLVRDMLSPTPPTPTPEDDMPRLIIQDKRLGLAAYWADTLVPVGAAAMTAAQKDPTVTVVQQDHEHTTAAFLHRNGSEAARLYERHRDATDGVAD